MANSSGHSLVGVWADCIMKVLGWFQISSAFNGTTNNYMPETNPDGTPVSGPGWVAYEKPGALPGDIVIIYQLQTFLLNGSAPSSTQLASVLWDLVSPGGLTYWTSNVGLKSMVSPTDLVSQFPHPGGALTPPNPDNPNGDPDILWTKVTSQYQLPGPGNATNPQFIRQILPGFGVRTLVWTDTCCTVDTMDPYDPPIIPPLTGSPPTNTPGTPQTGAPPTGTPTNTPGTPGPGPGPAGGGYGEPVPVPGTPGPYTGPAGGTVVDLTTNIDSTTSRSDSNYSNPSPTNYAGQANQPYINLAVPVGSRPPGRAYGNTRQPDFSHVPINHPLPWVDKMGDYDLHVMNRARPVGTRYMKIVNGGGNPNFIPKSVEWKIAADADTLTAMGLRGHQTREGVRAYVGSKPMKAAPAGRTDGRTEPYKQGVTEPINNPSPSADPIVLSEGSYVNKSQTIGGANVDKATELDEVPTLTSPRIVRAGNSQYIRRKKRLRVDAYKPTKMTDKGLRSRETSGSPGFASLRRRTFDISKARQATQGATAQYAALKMKARHIRDLRKVKNAPYLTEVKDPSGQFEIRPIVYRGGSNMAYVTIICGNVQSEKHAVLKQTAYIHTKNGEVYAANVGTSGVMQFGRVNPVQPGMYVISNPACMPGPGNLPSIIAGGQTWSFMTIVSTLQTIEGQVIANQIMNFLPAQPGDTDVAAPNRLPVGLMRDLDINSTADFLYDGTVDENWPVSAEWFYHEPSVVLQRNGVQEESVSLVLKVTTQSQEQNSPFRPLMELYEDTSLQSSGPLASFVSGPCGSSPGWYQPSSLSGGIPTGQYPGGGGVHTACAGMLGYGGAGGTSSYQTDSLGQIVSGPYNPSVYAGTHQCFLHFNYDSSQPATSDSIAISDASKYRLRVYNNGPATDLNGYVVYTQGLEIVPPSSSLSIVSGQLQGTLTTYHCNHRLKLVNQRTQQEIERRSSWDNGTITLGSNTPLASRLNVASGDTIRVFRPGYDNQYNSQKIVTEFTV